VDEFWIFLILVVSFTLAALILGILFKLIFREDSPRCFECGKRMTPFGDLDDDEKKEIGEYYSEKELREPDTGGVHACSECGIVYDDFTDKTKSSTGVFASICKTCNNRFVEPLAEAIETGEIQRFRQRYEDRIEEFECLRCKRDPTGLEFCAKECDADVKPFGCRRCATLYLWHQPDGSKFKFIQPLTDEEILKKPDADM